MKRIFTLLGRIEELALSLTFLGLALIAVVQVVCRYGFDISFTWFEEGGRYIGIFATFLGAGLGVKQGAHFSMDLLVDSATPAVSRILQLLIGLLCGSALLILARYGFDLVHTNYQYGNTSPAMQMPMYIAYLPIPFFSVIMALRFYLIALRALLGKQLKHKEQPA
jgi:C4-dicarboxylate transporter DctQ subunit